MSAEYSDFYCDIREFLDNQSNRIVDPDELLEIGECTLMLALSSMKPGEQAARLVSSINDVEPHESGIHTICYRPVPYEVPFPFQNLVDQLDDGYLTLVSESLHVWGAEIRTGYFIDEEPEIYEMAEEVEVMYEIEYRPPTFRPTRPREFW